jgi:hypothetical protein
MMPNPASLPLFSSRIRVVDKWFFDRHVRKNYPHEHQYTGHPWTIAERVSLKEGGWTNMASVCLIGGVNNGKQATLFHLVPDWRLNLGHEPWQALLCELAADLRQLQRGGSLRGFLWGGLKEEAPSYTSDRLSNSVPLYERMKAFFQSWEFPFTALGHINKDLGRNAAFDADMDTWILNATPFEHEYSYPVPILGSHDEVHIDPGDTLEDAIQP